MEKEQFTQWKIENRGCWYWLNIPTSWAEYILPEDLLSLQPSYNCYRDVVLKGREKATAHDWQKRYIADSQRKTYRKILRARRNNSFGDGMYKIRTTMTWLDAVAGKFNSPAPYNGSSGRPKKGDILMWVEKDELGRHIFLFQDNLYACRGAYLDGISRI